MIPVQSDTSYGDDGPWLISEKEIVDLSDLLEREWESVEERYERRVDEQVAIAEERLGEQVRKLSLREAQQWREKERQEVRKRYGFKHERLLRLYFDDGRAFDTTSFKEALRSPETHDRRVVAFNLSWKSAELSLTLEVNRGWSSSKEEMKLAVTPSDDPLARSIFASVKGRLTAPEVAPSRWMQRWRKYGVETAIVLGAVMFFLTLGALQYAEGTRPKRPPGVVMDILNGGVSAEEQGKALELILRQLYGVHTPESLPIEGPMQFPPWWLKWLLLLGLGSIIGLSVRPPKLELGMGAGRERLGTWRGWIKLAPVTIPMFLLGQVGTIVWSIAKAAFGL